MSTMTCFISNCTDVLEWQSKSGLKCSDLTIGIHRHPPSTQTEFELFYKEKLTKTSVFRCEELKETYSERLAGEIIVEGCFTKY